MKYRFGIPFPLLGKKEKQNCDMGEAQICDTDSEWFRVQIPENAPTSKDESQKGESQKGESQSVIKRLTSLLLGVGLLLAFVNYFVAIDGRLLNNASPQIIAIPNFFGAMLTTVIAMVLRVRYIYKHN